MQSGEGIKEFVRVAALGDLHCTKTSAGIFAPLFAQMAEHADVVALCGDLTDYGLAEEAHVLASEIKGAGVPIVAVLGNHDHESGQHLEVTKVLTGAGVHVLDGESIEIFGVGFAGVKGYFGGFGRRMLQAWGEDSIKKLVREAVDEALKLESALARLRSTRRIALLHYSPVQATVEGEPTEIFPFLGSSRLEEPLDRHPVTAVLHGHAHHGRLEGKTRTGVPVYNVAMTLLRRSQKEGLPYRVLKIPMKETAARGDRIPAA
jgi:Icc-related predicted phosphoesterase